MSAPRICEAQTAREAKRIFRKLLQPGAHIAAAAQGAHFLLVSATGARTRGAVIELAVMREFLARDWLRPRGTTPESWCLSPAGEGWYRRAQAQSEPFAAQHQARIHTRIETTEGTRRVTINQGESPIGWLRRRKLIDQAQFEAAERLRRDFTIAQLGPRLGVDFTAPIALGRRGGTSPTPVSETALAAKQRFRAAMAAAGPGLADILFDVCCHLSGLEEIETEKSWPRRSAKVVLDIALDRLALHYGMRVTGRARAPLRAWQAQAAE